MNLLSIHIIITLLKMQVNIINLLLIDSGRVIILNKHIIEIRRRCFYGAKIRQRRILPFFYSKGEKYV